MNNLVKTLEVQYLPLLKKLRDKLSSQYPNLRFNTFYSRSGSETPFQGHSIGLECIFPKQPPNLSDNVGFEICVCHRTAHPRLMADVVWGYPSGYPEAALTDEWRTSEDWPIVTSDTLDWLAKSFASLCQSFEEAVRRGQPPNE